VKSSTTEQFKKLLAGLPEQVQQQAREAYKIFRQDPYNHRLHFKQVHPSRPLYSIRIGRNYRALGEKQGNEVTWFWIGSHSDYDKLI
jgi:hypothetical protein